MSPDCCLITSECTASCHYLNIVSVKMVTITSANICFRYVCVKKIQKPTQQEMELILVHTYHTNLKIKSNGNTPQ